MTQLIADSPPWSRLGTGTSRLTPLIELLLTLLVVGALCILALPLGNDTLVAGLNARYLNQTKPADVQRGIEAMNLSIQLPGRLASLAFCGWVALRLGRTRLPRLALVFLLGAIWAGVWAKFFAHAAATPWYLAAGAMLAIALLAIRFAKPANTVAKPVNAIAYPGWVLFTGLGLIWLVDYSARAYPKLLFTALYQFDWLFVAYVVLTLVAVCGSLVAGLVARVFAALDKAALPGKQVGGDGILRRLAPLAIPLLLTAWSLVVVLLYGAKKPAVTSELLRLPFYFVGGWVLYRWAAQGRLGRALSLALLAACAVLIGLVGTRDFGQVLLLGLGLAVAFGTAVALVLGGRRVSVLAGMLATVSLASAGLELINRYGHLVSHHIFERAIALDTPFEGKLDYLSQLRWFAASTPPNGHGLTQVPWCGTLAMLTDAAKCNGVPYEMHSDYVFAALAGVWGNTVALAITFALSLWLASLVRAPVGAQAGDPNDLRRCVFTCFVVVTLVQLLFTSMGSVGLVVLTGVTFPLLAFGGASLIMSAALLGLGMQR